MTLIAALSSPSRAGNKRQSRSSVCLQWTCSTPGEKVGPNTWPSMGDKGDTVSLKSQDALETQGENSTADTLVS